MPADFARVAPGLQSRFAAGANVKGRIRKGLGAGRTDAGRPGLPRSQEVYS